jgi:hypothetical protein
MNRAALDEEKVRRVLTAEITGAAESTDEQSVWWNGRTWSEAVVWSTEVRQRVRSLDASLDDQARSDGWRLISRDDVFNRAEDPLDLFVAAMAWGFGNRGYGWRRTSDIIDAAGTAGVAHAIERLRHASLVAGAAGSWRAWSRGGEAKLHGLDTAFASKVAYFAAFDRHRGRGPLIADLNTAWALWALADSWDSRGSATLYADYVEWAESSAADLGCRSDDVERALFTMGPRVRRAWKQGRSA